jgi:uncharacterized protein (DUF2384 family)
MSRFFTKRFDGPRLSADEAKRQGEVTRLALAALVDAGAALSFLNTRHAELDGRPIDLAIASPEGLAAVEKIIAGLAPA